jgi:hypothetical protein
MASAFARVSIGSPTGPDGLPGDPAAEAERLALMAMRYAEARAAQAQSMELQALHGTPSQVWHRLPTGAPHCCAPQKRHAAAH